MRHVRSLFVLVWLIGLAACGRVGAPVANVCDDPEAQPLRDPALAQAVATRLRVDTEPTCADLAGLTTLEAVGSGIETLAGLEHATGLVSLRLDGNAITNIIPIVGLPALRFLSLADNPLRDLTPLSNLRDLFVLSLENVDGVANLQPLRLLTRLEHAYLSGMGVSDATPLAGLTRLRILHLDDNAIDDARFLVELVHLREVQLAGNRLASVDPLVANPGLAGGVVVDVRRNCLDIAVGAADRDAIDALVGRGVDVRFAPQDGC